MLTPGKTNQDELATLYYHNLPTSSPWERTGKKREKDGFRAPFSNAYHPGHSTDPNPWETMQNITGTEKVKQYLKVLIKKYLYSLHHVSGAVQVLYIQ